MLSHRGAKAPLDPWRAYATAWEEEPDAVGRLLPTAVVFLTNRECPFRCVMCDLWVNTLEERIAPAPEPVEMGVVFIDAATKQPTERLHPEACAARPIERRVVRRASFR